ncbi:hypothetical protein CPC08DRAFT_249719 [Agrocybe pediades]|nr:hypothetical protein CPC08DRAFT_249719 [Agrocybe pediades]
MPEEKVQYTTALFERFQVVSLWHFYPMTLSGKSILKNMLPQQSFVWECARTTGHKNISVTQPPPANAPRGILYRQGHTHRSRRNSNTPGKLSTRQLVSNARGSEESLDPDFVRKRPAVVNINRHPARTFRRRVDVQQFIQHNERIGIRHRASQTLYLSPLIDPVNNRKPSTQFGSLFSHLSRSPGTVQLETGVTATNSKNRSAVHLEDRDGTRKKKFKKSMLSPHEISYAQVKEEISKRELALMTLNYDIYCSPVPATFLRVSSSCAPGTSAEFHPTSRTKFRPVEYVDMTLSKPIGHGAVGVVHAATASMELESGEIMEHKVILKLAFSRAQKVKLKHEYDIYVHLSKVGDVQCILDVHGLFEDPDSNTLALVMEEGGRSLAYLNELEEDREGKVTGKDRTACLNALKSIHAAGVRRSPSGYPPS